MSDFAKMAAIAKHFVTNGDGAIHLHSENGTAYELAVGNDGALTVTNEATGAVSGVGGGGGLPTGGAPHQQLVTDAEGKALWEDRLAYAGTGVVEILPETTVTGEGEIPITEPFSADLVAGNEYTFTCNGAAYTCKAQTFDMEGVPCVALGNLGAMTGGDDTGEPFVLVAFPPAIAAEFGAYAMFALLDGATSATIKISYEGETIHRLDRKYLPEYMYGEEIKYVTFLSETALGDPAMTEGKMSMYVLSKPFDAELVMNATYTVMWNGVPYECTPFVYDGTSDASTQVVHLSHSGVFTISAEMLESDGAVYFGTVTSKDGSTSVTLSITGVVNTVHLVPDKYLPEAKNSNLANGSSRGSLLTVNAKMDDYDGYGYQPGENAIVLGCEAAAPGRNAAAIGPFAFAGAENSVAMGYQCCAKSRSQSVLGFNNIIDSAGRYVHIVGNGRQWVTNSAGETYQQRSNAHTLDWDGNAWYQGYVEGTKLILPSPNGTRWAITVGDDGTLSAAAVTE